MSDETTADVEETCELCDEFGQMIHALIHNERAVDIDVLQTMLDHASHMLDVEIDTDGDLVAVMAETIEEMGEMARLLMQHVHLIHHARQRLIRQRAMSN